MSTEATTNVIIDMEMLEQLRELEDSGDPGLILGLISDFKKRAPELIHEIQVQLPANQLNLVERAAHSLKSSAALLGGMQMSQTCQTIEDAAESKSPQLLTPELLTELDALFVATAHALDELMAAEAKKAA